MSSNTDPKQSSSPAEYYRTNPKRRGLLGHISFGVSSCATAEKFYTAILSPFGISLVFSNPTNTIIGYGFTADSEVFTLFERGAEGRAPGLGTHLAFNAPCRKAVREFWEAGVKTGGSSDGEPGVRENYGSNYYAAFLVDPDGFRVEAVYQEPVSEGEICS